MEPAVASAVAEDAAPRPAGGPAAGRPGPARVVIEPPRGWGWVDVGELWRYRELLAFFVWRDVKVRYKQTALGVAWAVLQPAMTMVVFTVFFGRLAGVSTGGVPAPLFYLTGLLPWAFFAAATTGAANSVLGAEGLITKIYFPRLAVPLAAVGAAAADFLVACGLLGAMCLWYGVAPTAHLLAAPAVVAVVAGLAAGLGTLFAALNVTFRDVRYLLPFLIQIGLFATPAIYLQPTGQERWELRLLMDVNPMNGLVAGFRAAVLGGPVPWAGVGAGAAAALAALAAGCLYFRKTEDRFADII